MLDLRAKPYGIFLLSGVFHALLRGLLSMVVATIRSHRDLLFWPSVFLFMASNKHVANSERSIEELGAMVME